MGDDRAIRERRIIEVLLALGVGEDTTYGDVAEVAGYDLSPSIRTVWIDDGDHDLKPRKASGRGHEEALDQAAEAVDTFLRKRCL